MSVTRGARCILSCSYMCSKILFTIQLQKVFFNSSIESFLWPYEHIHSLPMKQAPKTTDMSQCGKENEKFHHHLWPHGLSVLIHKTDDNATHMETHLAVAQVLYLAPVCFVHFSKQLKTSSHTHTHKDVEHKWYMEVKSLNPLPWTY